MKILISIQNSRYMQYLSAITATLSIASFATYLTWSSPTIPKLTSEDSPIGTTLTTEEASWVASVTLLAGIPGSLLTGFIVERLGRRGTLLLAGIPLFLPWIVIVFAKSAWTLIGARFIAGMGGSIGTIVASMYIGEIAEKDIRGKLGALLNMLKLTGSLYVLSVGPFISYTALALSSSAIPLIYMALFYFMPETPYYSIMIGKKDIARNNLIRLSSNNTNNKVIENQLMEIEDTVEYDMKNKSTLWEFISKPEYRKSIIVMFGIKTLQQFSGMNAIDAYTQTIIELTDSSIPADISSIICGFIQIPAVIIAAALVDKMGRKPLMIISSLGCAVALIGEGIYFYLHDYLKTDVEYLSWLPTTGLVLFLIMNPIGLFTLPYILLGELFATNIKGIAVSFFTLYGSLLGFLVVKFFKPISEAWGMYTMFWIFAGCCILGSIFVLLVLPETKGKTMAEIQEKLNKHRKMENSINVVA